MLEANGTFPNNREKKGRGRDVPLQQYKSGVQ